MQRKALILRFRNAAVFTDQRYSSDRVCVGKDRIGRSTAPRITVPEDTVDVRHVSNLLHVLMGERPVPSLRRSAMQVDGAIREAATGAVVKVEETSSNETKTVRKAVKDAWNTARIWYRLDGRDVKVKGGLLYHDRLARFLGQELYGQFLEVVGTVSGRDSRSGLTAQEGIECLSANNSDPKVQAFTASCRAGGRTAIANLIEAGGNTESITFHQGTGSRLNILVVNKGVEKVRRIAGTIIVPIDTPELLRRLENGTGVATFLEGGFAYVAGLDDWSDALVQGCTPVVEGEIVNVSNQGSRSGRR